MPNLRLSFACNKYIHVRALMEGIVRPQGIDLTALDIYPLETFQRMLQHQEFDVSEMGLKFYVSARALADPPFIAIPVFPSRAFRHSVIYVRADSDIKTPQDLIGKRVGEPFAYGHDGAIWARGILADHYGVPIDAVTYCTGALDKATFRDFAPFAPRAGITHEKIGPGQTLDEMLQAGEIDALYSAIVPQSVRNRTGKLRRLFEHYEAEERAYFRTTGIYPIMHTAVIRSDVYRDNPWVAQSLYQAFTEARDWAYDFYKSQELNYHRNLMVPWLTPHLEENEALMGSDFWPYGLAPNRAALDTFLRYHHEQGLSERRLTAEELFAPETLTDYSRFRKYP